MPPSRTASTTATSRLHHRIGEGYGNPARVGSGLVFTIASRATDCGARRGTLHLAHGDVATPAFVPLATRGAVKTLEPRDVEALGYEMVLGNTFHLFLSPGPELVAELGGLNRFMGWQRPIITDSGGFQVFSMGHGSVADEIKGRRNQAGAPGGDPSTGSILAIDERGVRFRSYLDGGERFLGPETSMSVQAALGSDIALVLDECTPFHVTRDYTARSMERTHRWLQRCLDWHQREGPTRAGRVRHRPGRGRARSAGDLGRGGRRQRVRRDRDRRLAGPRQGPDARGRVLGRGRPWTWSVAPGPAPAPARDRRDRRSDRVRRARNRHVRLRDADPARPPRRRARARPGGPLAAGPRQVALASISRSRSSTAVRARPAAPGIPAPTCTICCARTS